MHMEHQQETAEAEVALTTLEKEGVPERRPDAEALTSVATARPTRPPRRLAERHTNVQAALRRERMQSIRSMKSNEIRHHSSNGPTLPGSSTLCATGPTMSTFCVGLGQQLDQACCGCISPPSADEQRRYAIRRNDEEGGHGAKGLRLRIDDAQYRNAAANRGRLVENSSSIAGIGAWPGRCCQPRRIRALQPQSRKRAFYR